MNLIDEIVSAHAETIEIRRDLHRHPELAYEEHRTADVVAERLGACGIPVTRGLGVTGVVGTLKRGHGNRAIGLRADMDALAMDERNTFEHASRHPGRMHGCGHDGHTAMLLGAARHLAGHGGFDGTVHFIFQPAEEGAGGDGLFERLPVESVWGMHNFPTVPVGKFITRSGPFLASADTVRVKVNGVGGHGAMSHLARSPVNAACAIIDTLKTSWPRRSTPGTRPPSRWAASTAATRSTSSPIRSSSPARSVRSPTRCGIGSTRDCAASPAGFAPRAASPRTSCTRGATRRS